MVCLSGMVQLAVALGTVTLVAVTGLEGDPRARAGGVPDRRRARGRPRRADLRPGRADAGDPRGLRLRHGRARRSPRSAAGRAPASSSSSGSRFCGAAQAIVLLSRAAAAEMFPPERRARGMSFVLFGAVSGAIFGPLIFGPIFADRELTPHELALPWLGSSLFALAGLPVSFLVRPDPKELSKAFVDRGRGERAAGAARRDPAPPRRADRDARRGRELRGDGRRDEPRRLRRRRPRPRARRRLHDHQRAHRRHVRPRARRRRPDRPHRPRALDGDRPRR